MRKKYESVIVLPTRNRPKLLARAIKAIHENDPINDYLLILVDDSDDDTFMNYGLMTDGCIDIVDGGMFNTIQINGHAFIIRNDNVGQGSTRPFYVGVEKAFEYDYKYLVITGDDCRIKKNAIQYLIECAEKYKQAGFIATLGNYKRFFYMNKRPFFISTAGVLYIVKREVMDIVGNFNLDMPACEDLYLCMSVYLTGKYFCIVEPKSDVAHKRHMDGGLSDSFEDVYELEEKSREGLAKVYGDYLSFDRAGRTRYISILKKKKILPDFVKAGVEIPEDWD